METFKDFKVSLSLDYNNNFEDYNRVNQWKKNVSLALVLVQIMKHFELEDSFCFKFELLMFSTSTTAKGIAIDNLITHSYQIIREKMFTISASTRLKVFSFFEKTLKNTWQSVLLCYSHSHKQQQDFSDFF